MIGLDDYTVHVDRQLVGRIRYASERSPGLWVWTCVVTLSGPPFGEAGSLDEAKGLRFFRSNRLGVRPHPTQSITPCEVVE